MRFDLARRLEPIRPVADLGRGFVAETADPAWFLARQWQLGEHQGEDAASPLRVSYSASHVAIDPLDADPATDPRITPAEAIIESEADEWWTVGRRIRIGLACAASVPAGSADDPALRVHNLPPPYDRFDDVAFDGLALYRQRVALGLANALFADVPATPPADFWDTAELVHSATFTSDTVALQVPRHDGGDVDWYSVHGDAPMPTPAAMPTSVTVSPARMKFPGAPHPRWWQIEDARVDIGGFPPDRSHFATMLLIDLLVSHSDDWFSFPIDTTSGSVVTLHEVVVHDSFDEDITLTTPSTWSLFKVSGLGPTSLVVWPTVVTPLSSPIIDDVVVGIDEDANLLWAVEVRAAGREMSPVPSTAAPPPPPGEVLASDPVTYEYLPSTTLPRYWHPYVIGDVAGRRRFVQGRLADLTQRPPVPMPEPISPLLADPAAPANGPVHQVEPAAVPSNGLRLERRWSLGRRTDGEPVLWMQRRRTPLLGPPTSGLRFDVLHELPARG
jgi:hypothetical protein